MRVVLKPQQPKTDVQQIFITDHKSVPPGRERRVGYCGYSWDRGMSFIMQHFLTTREQRQVKAAVRELFNQEKQEAKDERTEQRAEQRPDGADDSANSGQ